MSTRFRRGLVVGKFAPLHRGHELLIRRALAECDEVVLVSYSKPELAGCDSERREGWLEARFPETRRLVVTDARVAERAQAADPFAEMPANDAGEDLHRRFVAYLCERWLGAPVDAVFTSEGYGEGFAETLTACFRQSFPGSAPVRHRAFDLERREAPISATMIRADPHGCRAWLAPEVYASFVERVCILGGESSGKSSLAEALARRFDTRHVREYGRELWEARGGSLAPEDLRAIAERQVADEEAAALGAARFLFCDTSPLTTLFYALDLFGRADPLVERLAERRYDHVLLCAPDFPFVQDGTRRDPEFRVRQHEWYVQELGRRGIRWTEVSGALTERIEQAEAALLGGERSPAEPPRA